MESSAWETVHGQFAGAVQRTLQGRYDGPTVVDYALPRQILWQDIVTHYTGPLIGGGWRLDRGMSTAWLGRGHPRV